MESALAKRPAHRMRGLSPIWRSPLDRFFRNELLDDWVGSAFVETVPSLNIREEKNNYIADMAAPGLKKEDFDISMDENRLTISCDKETETKQNEPEGYFRREYNYSSFSRTLTLPNDADSGKIVAKYADGVLTLTIPKKPEAQQTNTRKISVH